MRIGHGYDVHRLTENRRLILGGVSIPFEKGLLGHSDADVLTHALMDAMLGAAALGDIGKLFPDSDDRFLDADSIELLRTVVQILRDHDYRLVNADCTVIAQRPKISPYIGEMKTILSSAIGCEAGALNIKGTTEEKLGFAGSGEGIAAHAVCLIESIDSGVSE